MSRLLTQPDLPASYEALSYALEKAVDLDDADLTAHFARRIQDSGKTVRFRFLSLAQETRHLHALKALLPYIDITKERSPLLRAAIRGEGDILELLLPHTDARQDDSLALRSAAKNGHRRAVELLIPHSDAKARDSGAVVAAAEEGHWDIVEALAPYSDLAPERFLEEIRPRILALKENIQLRAGTPEGAARPRNNRI